MGIRQETAMPMSRGIGKEWSASCVDAGKRRGGKAAAY